jgi:hypothetical protein
VAIHPRLHRVPVGMAAVVARPPRPPRHAMSGARRSKLKQQNSDVWDTGSTIQSRAAGHWAAQGFTQL